MVIEISNYSNEQHEILLIEVPFNPYLSNRDIYIRPNFNISINSNIIIYIPLLSIQIDVKVFNKIKIRSNVTFPQTPNEWSIIDDTNNEITLKLSYEDAKNSTDNYTSQLKQFNWDSRMIADVQIKDTKNVL